MFITAIAFMALLINGCAALQYTGQIGGDNASQPAPAGPVRPTFRF